MEHKVYRVIEFEKTGPYSLRLEFDDGESQEIDFLPILEGEVYGPLRDEAFFSQVEIDPEVHTLVWPNGADFDPETLHDWSQYEKELRRMAREWAKQGTKAP